MAFKVDFENFASLYCYHEYKASKGSGLKLKKKDIQEKVKFKKIKVT